MKTRWVNVDGEQTNKAASRRRGVAGQSGHQNKEDKGQTIEAANRQWRTKYLTWTDEYDGQANRAASRQ
jgi:hypothetical protein